MKIAIISDTHALHRKLNIPDVDTIIHCGDFSYSDTSAILFLEWYGSLNIKNKILIAGNHDEYFENLGKFMCIELCSRYGITYLEDTSCVIDGIKFHGSPWTPIFCDWAFMADDEVLAYKWKLIPTDTDILITHGPEFGLLDIVNRPRGLSVGSRTLKDQILSLDKLQYHVFGHIHEAKGKVQGRYTSINASSVQQDRFGHEIRDVIVIDI